MKIVLTGSIGHIGKPLAQILVDKGHAVTVISSNPDKETAIQALGAGAAIGSITDLDFLTAAFTGADLVYTMLPPENYTDQQLDLEGRVREVVNNYKQAILKSGVKRVIHLSSIGAHRDTRNGLLRFHHIAETILRELPEDIQVSFMRPTGFYYNLLGYIRMIKNQGLIAANYGADDIVSWVAPADIAAAIAEIVENPPAANHYVRYVVSDELSCNETATILGKAIGIPDLQWIRISDAEMLNGLLAAGLQPQLAKGLTEMYSQSNRAVLYEDYEQHRPARFGKIKMKDFAKDFAVAFVKG
ncbi:NAD(P)H-binding protein [Chitinophaga sp. Cy-1792]|uniref:NmrA family NAD(P)-binding protein n=1 Tax=Chitinophaga sp. Cy-1792 TaxID=2608339 RepID=UPI0014221BCE|nr:NAD(P)H-binding protein [Chitinophaga sp. Cy-1792]NIG54078.1 NAD(P)H-binding protein [Chitinophaga sp. Cy-1792]